MSFAEFQASLLHADQRAALGLQLTDAEAHAVHADPATAQGWYAYWLSTQPASAPPAEVVVTPAPYPGAAQTPVQPTMPIPDPTAYDALVGNPTLAYPTASYPGIVSAHPVAAGPVKKRHTALWVILSILLVLILAVIGTTIFAFATARHWTAIDVPEHPETFHSEEYDTGLYDVTEDDINPCWVDQDWTDCTNLYVASYNAACTGVSLTANGTAVCSEYASMIETMKAQDGDGYYVATLGGYGSLHQTAERATREVSNDDYTPAETHEAICYLGFIGECEDSASTTRG